MSLRNMGGKIFGYNSVATLGRRFEGQAKKVLDFPSTSEEGVLYPKIFPPIFLKTLQEKISKLLKMAQELDNQAIS